MARRFKPNPLETDLHFANLKCRSLEEEVERLTAREAEHARRLIELAGEKDRLFTSVQNLVEEKRRLSDRVTEVVAENMSLKAKCAKETAAATGKTRFLRLVRDLINHELGEIPNVLASIPGLLLPFILGGVGILGYAARFAAMKT